MDKSIYGCVMVGNHADLTNFQQIIENQGPRTLTLVGPTPVKGGSKLDGETIQFPDLSDYDFNFEFELDQKTGRILLKPKKGEAVAACPHCGKEVTISLKSPIGV